MDDLENIRTRLERQGLGVALNHLRQAESALARREWESSNAQIRSFLEALFNDVARIRLGSVETGGAARKLLEREGILRERQARLVQQFLDTAGGEGSHAGTSGEDDARGRFLAGLGIAYLGLALIPEIRRVEDVIVGELEAPAGARLPRDTEIHTSCPTCGEQQTLAEAEARRDCDDTIYICRNGCQPIVVVSAPGDSPWPGRGYRLGERVVRNARDLYLPVLGTGREVLLPASPAALMKHRSSAT